MIIFKDVQWKNLLSTGKTWTKIQLDKNPNTLVIGYNGSGKSTLLDAVTFVLFGVSFRGVNKPQLVNSVTNKELLVEIRFDIGSKHYRVVRGMKPTVFEIHIDDVLLDQNAVTKDYQLYLEENILGFNYDAFTQTIVLGTTNFVSFMKLSAAERRNIIEDLLDIQIFSAMNKVVKEKVQAIKNKDGEIKRDIVSVNAQIELQQKHVKAAESNNIEQIEKLNKNRDEKDTRSKEILKLALPVTRTIGELNLSIKDEEKILEKKRKLEVYDIKITANLHSAMADLAFYETNNTCPTCTQVIDQKIKRKTIDQKNLKIDEYQKALTQLRSEQATFTKRIKEIEDIKAQVRNHFLKMSEWDTENRHLQNEIKHIDADILELSNRKPLSDDMVEVSKDLVQKLTNLTEAQKKNQSEKIYYDASAILLKDNGIKAKIVKQYLPVINKLINKYLTAMDFNVIFEIDSEFKESIKSRHKDIFTYSSFSEGEKKRIDLALIFTWREVARLKNSINTNLLILDELMDGALDNFGIEEVMKLLNSFGSETNIFVISPKQDILVDKFKGLIRFEKQGNFSKVA